MLARFLFATLMISLLGIGTAIAEPQIEWTQSYETYNGEGLARDLIQNSLQGYTLLGTSDGGWNNGLDPVLVRARSDGELMRVRAYPAVNDPNDYDIAFSIIEEDGSYFICGSTDTYGTGTRSSAFLMCTNLKGDFSWGTTWEWEHTIDVQATEIVALPNGNILVLAQPYIGNFDTGVYLLEYTQQGDLVNQYHFEDVDYVVDLTLTPNGQVAMIGYQHIDFFRHLFVLNADYSIEWTTQLNTFYPTTLYAHPDGHLFVAGKSWWDGFHRAYLAQYSADGTLLDDTIYMTEGASNVYDMTLRGDGNLLLAGYLNSDQMLMGVDLQNSLDQNWLLTGDAGNYSAMVLSWDGGVAVTGGVQEGEIFLSRVSSPVDVTVDYEEQLIPSGGTELIVDVTIETDDETDLNTTLWTQLVALDGTVTTLSSQTITSPVRQILHLDDLVTTFDPNLQEGMYRVRYVLGDSPNNPLGGDQFAVYKMGDGALDVADGASATTPTGFTLAPAYPNPFNASTTINVSLPTPSPLTIAVYDLTGRTVATLANDAMFTAGTHRFTLDASEMASGVYFVRAQSPGNAPLTQRITLVK
jgi:Secretion system C-terminal sorting domain/Domain of unknown function (DUF5122) beta-propeller